MFSRTIYTGVSRRQTDRDGRTTAKKRQLYSKLRTIHTLNGGCSSIQV